MAQVNANGTAGTPGFALGGWQVDPDRNRLRNGDRSIRLEPKLMAVLVHLADARGGIVSKDQLLDAVWPRRYVVEGVLKRAVSELRRALGDDARAPRYIETVYKVGYRLLVVPRRLTCDAAGNRVVTGTTHDIERALACLGPEHRARGTLTLIIDLR